MKKTILDLVGLLGDLGFKQQESSKQSAAFGRQIPHARWDNVYFNVWVYFHADGSFKSCVLYGSFLNKRNGAMGTKIIATWRTIDGAIASIVYKMETHEREFNETEKRLRAKCVIKW